MGMAYSLEETIRQQMQRERDREITEARQIITDLIDFCEQPDVQAVIDGAFDPDAVIQRGKRFLSGSGE